MRKNIEQIRDALAHNDKAALEFIRISDVREATLSMADYQLDIWHEDRGFKSELERFLNIDIITLD